MKINFNSNGKKGKGYDSELIGGNYEDMLKMRKKQLPKIQESIQDALKDYDGTSIAIIVMKEDENGMPDGSQVVMAGVSRMESQLAMGKALSTAADKTMEILMEGAKGDVKAMLAIASALVNVIEKEDM